MPDLVIIESPFAGDRERNIRYARRALLDSLNRDEAPFASHLLYTQVWEDSDATLRFRGILAGLNWGRVADLTAVYTDYGISAGMKQGIEAARSMGRPVEYRTIGENNEDHSDQSAKGGVLP